MGQNHQAGPLRLSGGRRQGTRRHPPPPPPSPRADGGRPERQRPRTPQGAALHPGGGTPQPLQAQPPAKRLRWAARTHPHYPPPTDNGTAAPRKAQTKQATLKPAGNRQGRGPGRGDLPPPPRHTDPLAADWAVPGAHGRQATPTARVYPGRAGRRQRMTGTGATGHPTRQGGRGAAAQPPLPPLSHPLPPRPASRGDAGPPPPRGRGDVLPPSEGTATPGGGGAQLDLHAARPSAPHRLLPRGSRLAGEPAPARQSNARTTPRGGTRQQTGTVWGPRPP